MKYCTLCINNMTPKRTLGLWYTHIAQPTTHTATVYIVTAYLAVMLLSLLAYCRG